VGRQHKEEYSLCATYMKLEVGGTKAELEEENLGGHDPNTGQNAIGEGETQRDRDR
jgi:hypothetical protein